MILILNVHFSKPLPPSFSFEQNVGFNGKKALYPKCRVVFPFISLYLKRSVDSMNSCPVRYL